MSGWLEFENKFDPWAFDLYLDLRSVIGFTKGAFQIGKFMGGKFMDGHK
jgi:hypothetical protein